MLVHVVLFWFDDNAPPDTFSLMERDSENLLKKIGGIEHLWHGKPAMVPRDVVDNTYNFGLCVIFRDRKAHDDYQIDPHHVEFGKRHRTNWKKILIYDF